MAKQPSVYHTIIPYLTVSDPAAAIDFYRSIFGAEECLRLDTPDGAIIHAEIKIGDTRFMIGGEYPDMDIKGPGAPGGSPVALFVYVDDVDATVEAAVAEGATVLAELEDQFHGNRTAKIADPSGHLWMVGALLDELPDAEITRRFKDMMGG